MGKIDEHHLLKNGGIVVCEHSHDVELPETIGELTEIKHEKYGIISVTIYSRFVEQ
jgi:16S rRNA G966 N2-methylase RsmD